MNRQISSLAVGVLLLLAAPAARADDPLPPLPPAESAAPTPAPAPGEPPPPEPETESRWYGWQILIVDGASIVTMPIVVGLGGYLLGGPIVHAAHDRWGTGALSLGVRVAGPSLGLLAMGAGRDCRGDFCGLGLLVGAGVGAAVAVAVDVALLAHEKVPVTKEAETGSLDHRLFSIKPSVTPELTPQRAIHGASFGVSGTF